MGGAKLVLLLVLLCGSASAQQKVRISLFYAEQPAKAKFADGTDSIKIYVKEPFQEMRRYASPDFGFETNIDFIISEYCPVQVCKNNSCFELFIDSEQVKVMISADRFTQNKPLNSPLSVQWQLAQVEMRELNDARLDSLTDLFAHKPTNAQVLDFYQRSNDLFKPIARKWITENKSNPMGWILFLRRPEQFEKDEIFALTDHFSSVLSNPSIQLIKTRLAEYKNRQDPTRSIYTLFQF